jgi:hypothetical protein
MQTKERTLPSINCDLRFDYAGTEMRLIADCGDWGGGERLEFIRNDGRWRSVDGPFISVHAIAASIFKYSENPTEHEMNWMGDYVAELGKMLDEAFKAIQQGSAERIRAREERELNLQRSRILEAQDIVKRCCQSNAIERNKTFVYLMRHINGLTKIGRSKNPRARERTLQAEDPRLTMIFNCEALEITEKRLHQIFDSVRVRGEWFDLMPHHVDWIVFFLTGISKKWNT